MEHQQNRPPRKPPGTATPKDRRKPADLRLTFASARAKPPIAPPLAREEDNALVLGLTRDTRSPKRAGAVEGVGGNHVPGMVEVGRIELPTP